MTLNSNKEEVSFCKYCYSCYTEGNKCDYCDQIYASNVGDAQIQQVDGEDWIGCDICDTWNHTSCEIKSGVDKEYREAALAS